MRRYWVGSKTSYEIGETVEISGDRFRHIVGVCRQSVGAKFEILTGDGKAYLVEVTDISKKTLLATVKEERYVPPLKKPYLHLYLSLPKFSTFEKTLEKMVELGVHTVTPVFSEYSFVKSLKGADQKKASRWEKIIISATQQTGRSELMTLSSPRSLKECLEEINRNPNATGLFPYEGEAAQTAREALQSLKSQDGVETVAIFVGSEGGFSNEEVQEFQRAGLAPLTLGDQVLRVETACVTITSVIKYELGLLE